VVKFCVDPPIGQISIQVQLSVSIKMQTPIKANTESGGLMFYDPPENRIFFRGRVRVMFNDDTGKTLTRYIHIVQRRNRGNLW
jgi:hypothetical protein